MSDFDPYHKWLGIPPAEQPPHHYRLLGIAPFEPDLDVIEAAADRQMAYIRQCATGPYTKESQKILNELSAARVCLLNPTKKKTYDGELKLRLAPAKSPETATAISRPRVTRIPAKRQPDVDAGEDDEYSMVVLERPAGRGNLSLPPRRGRSRKRSSAKPLWLWGGAGGVGFLLMWGLVHLVTRPVEEVKPPAANGLASGSQGAPANTSPNEQASQVKPPAAAAGGKEPGSQAVTAGQAPVELHRAVVDRTLQLKGEISVMVGESRAWVFIKKIDEVPAENFKIALISLKAGSVEDLKLICALPFDQLQLSGQDFTDEHLAVLAKAKSIGTLRIEKTSCTDAGLEHLARCPDLKMLHLFGGGFTPAGFKHLAKIPGLFQMVVGGQNFTEEHIEALAGLPELKFISIQDCHVTGAGFRSFRGKSQVNSLSLIACPFDAAGIEAISEGLPDLLQLFVSSVPLNDDSLGGFRKLKRLQVLQLILSNVTDAGLPVIAEMTSLYGLTLHGSRLNGSGFREIAGKMPNLRVCNLFNTQLNDEGLQHLLAAAPRLENLLISNTAVTDAGLKPLKDVQTLKNVVLSKTQFSAEALDELRKALPKVVLNLQ